MAKRAQSNSQTGKASHIPVIPKHIDKRKAHKIIPKNPLNKAKIDEYLLFSMAASQLITEILIPVNKKPRK